MPYELLASSALPIPIAGKAVAPANGLAPIKRMALGTMSLLEILGRGAESSKGVDLVCHWFKVIRVNAAAITTKVIKFGAFRNRANKQDVRDTVCEERFAFIASRADLSIADVTRGRPLPTAVCTAGIDLLPEAGSQWSKWPSHEANYTI